MSPITRNELGIRDFQEEDIKWVEFIKYMRDSGLSIESLAKYSTLYQQGDATLLNGRKSWFRSTKIGWEAEADPCDDCSLRTSVPIITITWFKSVNHEAEIIRFWDRPCNQIELEIVQNVILNMW